MPHELTHSVLDLLAEQDPVFHRDFMARAERAFDQARLRAADGKVPNSRYGLTDVHEYVAEGVGSLVVNPEHLQSTDPGLASLSSELLEHAASRLPNPAGQAGTMLGLCLLGMGASARLVRGRREPKGSP